MPRVTIAVMGTLDKRILGLSLGIGSGNMYYGYKQSKSRAFDVKFKAKSVQKARAEERRAGTFDVQDLKD